MRPADLARLLVLAALWGGSFILFRIVVPTLGAIATTEARVAIAGAALVAWQAARRAPVGWWRSWRPMAIVGVFNSALPFALFAFAAKTLPAAYLAILNATSPLFGAAIAALWLSDPFGARQAFGIACGIAGVATLVRLGPVEVDAAMLVACAACLVAAASYGFAGNYTRKRAAAVAPGAMATGSQVAAALVLLPLLLVEPVVAIPSTTVVVGTATLALASTAVAYLLYFRLIRDVGATRALTVTFLVPLFAIGWGWLVLGEMPTLRMAVGGCLVIVATWSIVGARRADRAA